MEERLDAELRYHCERHLSGQEPALAAVIGAVLGTDCGPQIRSPMPPGNEFAPNTPHVSAFPICQTPQFEKRLAAW
jgi:hypothetical protein